MAKRKVKELAEDDIAMFDMVKDLIGQLDEEIKRQMLPILLLLLSCTEGSMLNMNKVAELVSKLSDGRAQFLF